MAIAHCAINFRNKGANNAVVAPILAVWIALCGSLFAVAFPAAAGELGRAAVEFSLPNERAEPVKLSALRGSPVYVDFWASWCVPCLKSFPWMNEMQQRYGGKGLRIIAVNVDQKRADADQFLARVPPKFSVVFDPQGAIAKAYGIKAMPSSFLIDRQGRVQFEHLGFRESSREELEAAIVRLVGEP